MAYILLFAAFPILLLYNTRLGFAVIVIAIILLYRSKTQTATRIARNRVTDDDGPGRPLKPWTDPWGTGKRH